MIRAPLETYKKVDFQKSREHYKNPSEIKHFGRAEALRRSILLISLLFYKQNRKVENRKFEVRIAAPTCN